MGLFNLGSSRSASEQVSQSQGQSVSTSRSSSSADASQSSFSNSTGSSFGWNRSGQNVFAADVFQSLFRDSSNVAGTIATGGMTEAANSLFMRGESFLAGLGDLSGAGPSNAGESYLTNRVNGGPSLVDDQIAALESDLTKYFGESLLPGIRSDAIGAGQLGGSRESIATGLAAQGLLSELTKGIVQIRTADQAQRDTAATTLAGAVNARRLAADTSGMGALPGLFDVFNQGAMARLSPYLALAQILGGPTTLSEAIGQTGSSEQAVSGSQGVSTSRSSSAEDSSSVESSSSRGTSWSNDLRLGVGWG